MHSSQCCCCFCYDFGRAVDAECQERSKLFVVDRKILCCLSTVSCKPPANSPMNNRDCFYVHSVLFIFQNAPLSPKQKLQHSHFGILSLSDTCTAHTHTLSLPHSLLFLRMWDEGSDKKKHLDSSVPTRSTVSVCSGKRFRQSLFAAGTRERNLRSRL